MISTRNVAGEAMYDFARTLFPICRSITGEGVRQTLTAVRDRLPELEMRSVPSGTTVNDWTVPDEWNISEAYIADVDGNRIVDFARNNLHILNYSSPVRRVVEREELLRHIHTLPDQPDLIPYRTSYYHREWGFCLEHNRLSELRDDEYEVVIDATLAPGCLNYAELVLPGDTADEILFSTHVCHPSLANDNLSGIALVTFLAQRIGQMTNRRFTYRFLFVPGTIGAITWLAQSDDVSENIKAALVVALVGAAGSLHYKQTPTGDSRLDRVVRRVLAKSDTDYKIRPFSPYGYDERQYTSPGYGIPAGSLTRIPHGEFPQYHTSADNMEFIHADVLGESLEVYTRIVEAFESERIFVNNFPFGEPQLGRRGLYDKLGGGTNVAESRMAMLWLLNRSTGDYSFEDIVEQSGIGREVLGAVAETLVQSGVLSVA